MKKMKLVVVGNGMAGMRTVEELLKMAPDFYEITVFGDEPHPNYNRILLSPVLAGEQTINEIILNTREWYEENNITLHVNKRINKIDRLKRVVYAEDGTSAQPFGVRQPMPLSASGMLRNFCWRICSRTSSWFRSVQPQTAFEVEGGA